MMNYNGKEYRPYTTAFNKETYAGMITGRKGSSPIPTGRSKVTTLDAVIQLIKDGDVISYPHYYRTGDYGLKLVVDGLRAAGKKGIILYANAIFDHTDPWLIEAFRDGTLLDVIRKPLQK